MKYVTTGALPPGASSGQSFVHDPKIAGTSEVKGQIKLKFKNRINQTMVRPRGCSGGGGGAVAPRGADVAL